MNDSQTNDYLEIINSLVGAKKEWEEVPEIVHLSMKAVIRLFEQHSESFIEHKTLMNEQSLRLKEFQLKMNNKCSKKDVQGEVLIILNSKQLRKDEDCMSEYEKLIKQSRYQRERSGNPTVQELKTIAQIIAEKQTDQAKNHFKNELLSQKLDIQDKISRLKEDIRGRMNDLERQKRDIMSQCRQAHSRIEESQARPIYAQNQQKINILDMSNKRVTQGLSCLLTHVQEHFFTKEQISLLLEREKEKKSPQKIKIKEMEKSRHKFEDEFQKDLERSVVKIKSQYFKEFNQFKSYVMKEIGKMVNSQTINNLVDTIHKENHEKYQNFSEIINKIQMKINQLSKDKERNGKQILTKSEKRPEKKSSPSKSYQNIQSNILRLQKNIVEKQKSESKSFQQQIQKRFDAYDKTLSKELERREKHLCQVIEQTYKEHVQSQGQTQDGFVKKTLKKLNETNLYCKYLYIGTKQCKKDNCIPWQKEALNNIVENFVWKKESPSILVNSGGLYQINVGLFGDINAEVILLVNGDFLAEIPKPSHSKSTGNKIRGAVLSEIFLLPGMSKIAVRVSEHFYGQAFLQLKKM